MKRNVVVGCALVVMGLLAACGGDDAACKEALAAFERAKTECDDPTAAPDTWFNEGHCNQAADDMWDNTDYYTCIKEKYDANPCKTDADGMLRNEVEDYDTLGDDSNPQGCYDKYQQTQI